jgi:hypothetical protein
MLRNIEAVSAFEVQNTGGSTPVSIKQLQKARLSERARQFRILAQRLRFHIDGGTLVPEAIDALRNAEIALTIAADKVEAQAEDRPGPGRYRM